MVDRNKLADQASVLVGGFSNRYVIPIPLHFVGDGSDLVHIGVRDTGSGGAYAVHRVELLPDLPEGRARPVRRRDENVVRGPRVVAGGRAPAEVLPGREEDPGAERRGKPGEFDLVVGLASRAAGHPGHRHEAHELARSEHAEGGAEVVLLLTKWPGTVPIVPDAVNSCRGGPVSIAEGVDLVAPAKMQTERLRQFGARAVDVGLYVRLVDGELLDGRDVQFLHGPDLLCAEYQVPGADPGDVSNLVQDAVVPHVRPRCVDLSDEVLVVLLAIMQLHDRPDDLGGDPSWNGVISGGRAGAFIHFSSWRRVGDDAHERAV